MKNVVHVTEFTGGSSEGCEGSRDLQGRRTRPTCARLCAFACSSCACACSCSCCACACACACACCGCASDGDGNVGRRRRLILFGDAGPIGTICGSHQRCLKNARLENARKNAAIAT
ncbi:hypothetical protein MUK42_36324 [Musa troglodytarum]|uniref:Uncharacterized protein n=1 Tax=Musa troglodytarum TaxID=320322 RepID=A0A9E7GKN1_9LILI|nr:hypothetical protein MUK42_36324 [Musa troglodytarum]